MSYGFSYNGIASSTKSVEFIRQVERNASPPTEAVNLNVTGYQGSYPVRHDDQGRTIPVVFLVTGSSAADLRTKIEAIADWLRPVKDVDNRPEPKALIFDDATDRRWMVYPVGQIRAEEHYTDAICTVDFFSPEPYAEAITEKNTNGSDTNGGTEPAPPEITVTVTAVAGITDLKVELDGTDKFLFLEGAFAQNTVIVFNKATRMATVDAVDARDDLHHTRRWFDLPAGAFVLTTTPASGITVAVKFRERWR